jgi:hypothetical protein
MTAGREQHTVQYKTTHVHPGSNKNQKEEGEITFVLPFCSQKLHKIVTIFFRKRCQEFKYF